MDPKAALASKLAGRELAADEIEAFFRAYLAGELPEHAAAALVAAVFVRGLSPDELERWTRAMLESGERFRFDELDGPKVDKHSTGGVGDKVSIPLAPALAACGAFVPMISGRGLGHTGGTLDKLESIPGLATSLDAAAFRSGLAADGAVFGAQTDEVVPADRRLYALRDDTGMVASIPLIASSILSKKLAEGLDALVLDVKFGSGALLPDPEDGAELGRTMVGLARRFGLAARVVRTAMDRPLGRAAGNAREIAESVACLRGEGPADLRALVARLGGELCVMAGLAPDLAAGEARIARALDDGSALERLARIVARQGGDARCVEDPARLPAAPAVEAWRAPASGRLAFADVRSAGLAVRALGGGRRALGDAIDPAVGLVFERAAGEEVRAGEPLVRIHHRDGRGLEEARAHLDRAIAIGTGPEPAPLVLAAAGGEPSAT